MSKNNRPQVKGQQPRLVRISQRRLDPQSECGLPVRVGSKARCGGVLTVRDWHPDGVRGDSRYELYCTKCGRCDPNGYARRPQVMTEGLRHFNARIAWRSATAVAKLNQLTPMPNNQDDIEPPANAVRSGDVLCAGAVKCYYCGGVDHDDTPCPKRSADADRFAASGRREYPPTRCSHSLEVSDRL